MPGEVTAGGGPDPGQSQDRSTIDRRSALKKAAAAARCGQRGQLRRCRSCRRAQRTPRRSRMFAGRHDHADQDRTGLRVRARARRLPWLLRERHRLLGPGPDRGLRPDVPGPGGCVRRARVPRGGQARRLPTPHRRVPLCGHGGYVPRTVSGHVPRRGDLPVRRDGHRGLLALPPRAGCTVALIAASTGRAVPRGDAVAGISSERGPGTNDCWPLVVLATRQSTSCSVSRPLSAHPRTAGSTIRSVASWQRRACAREP